MSPIKTGTSVASAVALFAIASLANAAPAPEGSTGSALNSRDTVHCYGLNNCKGSADCKTSRHECKGMNSCRGQGFKAMAAGMCLRRGGTIGDIS